MMQINTEQVDEQRYVNIKEMTINERCVHHKINDINIRSERELMNQPHYFRYVDLYNDKEE